MPVWIWIAQFVFLMIQPLIGWIFRVIGIGFVSYVGYNALLDVAMEYVTSRISSTSMDIQQILGLAKVDVAINIYFAAVTTRFVLAGINKAQDRRRAQVWRKPGGTSIEA
ncbi:DUF2523 domain-containing protein [Pseudomonas sp. BMS12]|uniref:DUF2523 domain-containing protein n=1 Tax=Pseudomonas sp. BMS12 TaxID=1796033 RepID=UPI00083B5164|nr:DUF2523 domain-containing protein [Pseudomonas sp. BMS12]